METLAPLRGAMYNRPTTAIAEIDLDQRALRLPPALNEARHGQELSKEHVLDECCDDENKEDEAKEMAKAHSPNPSIIHHGFCPCEPRTCECLQQGLRSPALASRCKCKDRSNDPTYAPDMHVLGRRFLL